MNNVSAIIAGSGIALPHEVITNRDLEKIVDTSDEWIVSRTGIRERRRLETGKSAVDLAAGAAAQALEAASLKATELDMIIVATVTPDYPTPATSCLLQARLGALQAGAFDLSAGCTGFIYALTTGRHFIESGACRNVLVVGVEVLTRVTDWQDRGTCVLFGDGAGAVILKAVPATGERGILHTTLKADGRGAELLLIPGGGSVLPASQESLVQRAHYVKMNGNEIFKFAVKVVEETLYTMLEETGLRAADLDCLILHQANLRIIEHIRKKLRLTTEQVPINIDRFGNTSSATIPLALHEEITNGRLKQGDLLAMIAFGAGLTWGGALVRW